MAFIIPKRLAAAVAERVASTTAVAIAEGYSEGKDLSAEDRETILPLAATIAAREAESVLTAMIAEQAAEDAAAKATPEGKAKARVAALAGKAKLMSLAMSDSLAGRAPTSEQSRRGAVSQRKLPASVLASELRKALSAAGINPEAHKPSPAGSKGTDGKPVKRKAAPSAVVALNQLSGMLVIQAQLGSTNAAKTQEAKAG